MARARREHTHVFGSSHTALLCSRQKDSEALNAPQSKPVAILMESENVNAKWDFADHQVQKKKKISFRVEEAESLRR